MIRGNSWLVVQMGTYFCASKTLPILCRAQGCLNQLRATAETALGVNFGGYPVISR